jgi:hypothetical protein
MDHLDVHCYISKGKSPFDQTETPYSFTSNFTYAVQPGFHGAYTLNSTYSGGNTGTLNLFSTRLELTDSVNGVDVYTLNGWYINGTGTWLYLWDTDADTKIGLVFSGDSGNKLIATGQTASAQLKTELETMGFTGIDVSDIGAEIYDLYGEEP